MIPYGWLPEVTISEQFAPPCIQDLPEGRSKAAGMFIGRVPRLDETSGIQLTFRVGAPLSKTCKYFRRH